MAEEQKGGDEVVERPPDDWWCVNCQVENPEMAECCMQCYQPREFCELKVKKKQCCKKCKHRHRQGKSCHVYVYTGEYAPPDEAESDEDIDDDDDDVSLSEEEEESSEGDDSDGDSSAFGGKKKKKKKKKGGKGQQKKKTRAQLKKEAERRRAKAEKKAKAKEKRRKVRLKKLLAKPLRTPLWARQLGLRRCNCVKGVPEHDNEYEPIGPKIVAGHLAVDEADIIRSPKLWLVLNVPAPKPHVADITAELAAEKEAEEARRAGRPPPRSKAQVPARKGGRFNKQPPKFTQDEAILHNVILMLDARSVAALAATGKMLHERAERYPHYTQLRDMSITWGCKIHEGKVECVLSHNGHIYSSGDRCVKITNLISGEFEHKLARDSCAVNQLMEFNEDLFVCSGNGSVKVFTVMHDVRRNNLSVSLWEHTEAITDMAIGQPSHGLCEAHQMPNHTCHFFTCARDRTIRVWDLNDWHHEHCIQPFNPQSGTYTSLATSYRHLYVGSTRGEILVYPLEPFCERTDTHECSEREAPVRYCLQTTIVHEDEVAVTALHITGQFRHKYYMFSAGHDGLVRVWWIPQEGFYHDLLRVLDGHRQAVSMMTSTNFHLMAASEDGTITAWNLTSFEMDKRIVLGGLDRIRAVYVEQWTDEREVEEDTPIAEAGHVLIGTNTGIVHYLPLGSHI